MTTPLGRTSASLNIDKLNITFNDNRHHTEAESALKDAVARFGARLRSALDETPGA